MQQQGVHMPNVHLRLYVRGKQERPQSSAQLISRSTASPGGRRLAVGGRRERSQGPCWVSWPQPGAPGAAEAPAAAVAAAVLARGEPGRWGLAGAEHLHHNRVKMEMLYSHSLPYFFQHIRIHSHGTH